METGEALRLVRCSWHVGCIACARGAGIEAGTAGLGRAGADRVRREDSRCGSGGGRGDGTGGTKTKRRVRDPGGQQTKRRVQGSDTDVEV